MNYFEASLKNILFVLWFICLLCNCKKKQEAHADTTATIKPLRTMPAQYFGQFSCIKSAFVQGNTITHTTFVVSAFFSGSPLDSLGGPLPNTMIGVGKVMLNATVLTKDSVTITNVKNINYRDTSYTVPVLPFNWRFSESTGSPEFSFTNNDDYPTFTGYSNWKDTVVKKSQPFTISIPGIANADEVEVSVIGGTSVYAAIAITKKIPGGSESVTFTPTELAKLGSYLGDGSVQINLAKSTYSKPGEKYYRFNTIYICAKAITIKD